MSKYVLYNHGGSGNHGCEALVRTATAMLGMENVRLLSDDPEQDKKYNIDELVQIDNAVSNYTRFSMRYLKAYAKLKRTGDYFDMDVLPYTKALNQISKDEIAVSIGGDNYCYEFYPKFIRMHQRLVKRGVKTVLLGCSIEPDSLNDSSLLDDLKSYDLITARESITFNALKKAGLENAIYCPDTAFVLEKKETSLPKEFQIGNTIGLNLSPLVLKKGNNAELILDNYRELIGYILDNTDKSVALIPHVAWKDNDDSEPLRLLYQEFYKSGRVCLLPDMRAEEIKYCISCCEAFIGARTHATIAAYSSCVPTIVLGYSVKSRGIAKDLFGTESNYVLSIESLETPSQLEESFCRILKNENQVKNHLSEIMPDYIERINILANLEQMINGIN